MPNCWRDFVRAYRVTNPDLTYKQALTEASKIYRREINNAIEKKVCEPVKRKKKQVNITKKQPKNLVKGEIEFIEDLNYLFKKYGILPIEYEKKIAIKIVDGLNEEEKTNNEFYHVKEFVDRYISFLATNQPTSYGNSRTRLLLENEKKREVYKDKIDEIYKKHQKKQPEKLVKEELKIDEPIEYTSIDIRPKKKNQEYFKQCFKTISDTMDLIYSKSRSKNYDEIIKRLQKNRVFWDLVTTNDFYPTPPEVSKIIYDDINIEEGSLYNYIDIYDMTAGLGSLSIHFLENIDEINKITLIDIAKPFTDLLECFEKENNKVKVVNINALEYDVVLTPYKSNRTYFLCNPPFRAPINGKFEKDAWIFFIFHIYNMIKNLNSQKAYFIVPKSTLFEKSYDNMLELTIPEATFKRIKKIFNIDDEYEDIKTIRFEYIQDVKGFKKIGNMGKPTEVGITTMLIKTTY